MCLRAATINYRVLKKLMKCRFIDCRHLDRNLSHPRCSHSALCCRCRNYRPTSFMLMNSYHRLRQDCSRRNYSEFLWWQKSFAAEFLEILQNWSDESSVTSGLISWCAM